MSLGTSEILDGSEEPAPANSSCGRLKETSINEEWAGEGKRVQVDSYLTEARIVQSNELAINSWFSTEKQMTFRSWNDLWADGRSREYWTEPDPTVVQLISRLKQQRVETALDIGCGIGRHVLALAAEGLKTHAMDSSPEATEACRTRLREEGLAATIAIAEVQALPYPGEFCDFVLCWNVIYHSTRKGIVESLSEIARVLRSDGLLCLTLNSTHNRDFGLGTEVEPATFDNPDKIDGQHLHHYSDEEDVRALLSIFRIESLEEMEQGYAGTLMPDSWHWTVVARRRPW